MWGNTDEDIQKQVNLRLGFVQAESIQEYQILATVVSAIFGEKKPEPTKNFRQAESQLRGIIGKGK